MKIELNKLTCVRCGHEWTPRKPEINICPKCKSHYWDIPKASKGVGTTGDQNNKEKL